MRKACGVAVAGVLAIAALTQPTRAADEDAPTPLNFDFPTAVALCADSAKRLDNMESLVVELPATMKAIVQKVPDNSRCAQEQFGSRPTGIRMALEAAGVIVIDQKWL